jgi:hypothetical protein
MEAPQGYRGSYRRSAGSMHRRGTKAFLAAMLSVIVVARFYDISQHTAPRIVTEHVANRA